MAKKINSGSQKKKFWYSRTKQGPGFFSSLLPWRCWNKRNSPRILLKDFKMLYFLYGALHMVEASHVVTGVRFYRTVREGSSQMIQTLQYCSETLLNVTTWYHCLYILVFSPCEKSIRAAWDPYWLMKQKKLLSCW